MEWSTLEAQGVHAAYRDEEVVAGVSLTVKSGDFIGIIGPNGSGKSSFLKALSRALRPREGIVLLGEEDVYELPARQVAQRMALVPQESPLTFSFTALEVVLMGRNPHLGRLQGTGPLDLEMARQAMERANVWHLADRPVTELSGGERQRVVIAQALAQDTGLLLLDEPTQHLDINHQLSLLKLLSDMRQDGLGVLIVLHDINLAAQYCERIIILRKGREFARGEPSEVLTSANIREVFGVGAVVTRHAVTERPNVIFHPFSEETSGVVGPRVHLVCGGASGGALMRDLLEAGAYLTAGVLNMGDGDEEVGQALGIEMAIEVPFSHVSEAAHQRNLQLIAAAEVVVLSDLFIGPGNLANLRAMEEGLKLGKPTFLYSLRPIQERDHTGGSATELYSNLIARGAVEFASREALVEAVLKQGKEEE